MKKLKATYKILLLIPVILILSSCSGRQKLKPAQAIRILPRTAWDAMLPREYKQHVPVRVTIHHEGTKLGINDNAAKKINAIQRWGMGSEKKWADIPYHYLIAPDGTIFEGRDPFTVGETSTEYDPSGHLLICCLGNLEVQPLPDSQLQSLIRLTAYAAKQFKIPADSIASHRNYSRQTTCPGKNLYPYIENGHIKKEVKKLLKK